MKLDGVIIDNGSNLLLYGGRFYHQIEQDRFESRGWINRSNNSYISFMKSSSNGSYHLCLEDGILRIWGDNKDNNLGLGDVGFNKFIYYPVIIPIQGVKEFSCGNSHVLALLVDSSLWGFGDNSHGQLSSEDIGKSKMMTPIGKKMKSISCWGDSSCAIDLNNKLSAWGFEFYNFNENVDLICYSQFGILVKHLNDLILLRNDEVIKLSDQFNPTLIISGINFASSRNSDGDVLILTKHNSKLDVSIEKGILKHEQDILSYKNFLIIGDSDHISLKSF